MSRLPMLSTPGRSTTPTTTGIPTPTHRRPRSSLGPGFNGPSTSTPDEAMDRALQEALRTLPPSSLRGKEVEGDPDTPTQPLSLLRPGSAAPRTPGLRPRTPSGLGLAHPTTPLASRASRPPVSVRPSLSASTNGGLGFTPRRVSVASSTNSTTPGFRRPESRASNAHEGGGSSVFMPVIGDRVRVSGMGMEGTLRFMGHTQFKDGVWAGVELEGGFAGKGKNDGSVDGVVYFTCPPLCGVFVFASKLCAPTSGPSRPSSVASSHRSLASSQASFSLHGRATPSFESFMSRPATTTPARATSRAVSSSVKGRLGVVERYDDSPLDNARPMRSMLGNSTLDNAGIAQSVVTAGSRASKYIGMTAKQLDNARAGTNGLMASTTTTPKPSRVSMGGVTPARSGRQSVGGSFATPKARGARPSAVNEAMPPPPSPGKVNRAMQAHHAQLEEEIRELQHRNAELEKQLTTFAAEDERRRTEALESEVDRVKEESDSLRHQLSASQADAADASKLAEELQLAQGASRDQLDAKEKELVQLQREMRLAAQRVAGELEAGMEAKRSEVRKMQLRAEQAESEGAEMRALVEELTHAGQATISLYETKQFDFEDRIRTLEERNRLLDEKLQKAREENEKAVTAPPVSTRITAAEIDNETLTAQVKHFQNKVNHLEDEIDDVKSQAESESESWKAKLAKARDAERLVSEQVARLKLDIGKLNEQAGGAKARIGELEGAWKESQSALEAARAEIEGLRVEAADASSMRTALQTAVQTAAETAAATEKSLSARDADIHDLKAQLSDMEAVQTRTAALVVKVTSLENEITSLQQAAATRPSSNHASSITPIGREPKPRLSIGSLADDPEKKLRGFQHIIQELSAENAELKEKYDRVHEEAVLLKEEVKLLEEANEMPNGGERANGNPSKELLEARAVIQSHVITIKELNREMSELESLVESKIYREDELETRLSELSRELDRLRARPISQTVSVHPEETSHTRTSSINTSTTDRCELCEGAHDLDACPIFAGNSFGGEDGKPSPLAGKGKDGKFCADCESTEHNTADCPMAEDVF